MRAVVDAIMAGAVTPAQIGSLLTALRMKGETVDELVGTARAMRAHMLRVPSTAAVVDTCGTGGDGADLFNVSTAVALVVAGAGVRGREAREPRPIGARRRRRRAGDARGPHRSPAGGGRALSRAGRRRVLFRAAFPCRDAVRRRPAARDRPPHHLQLRRAPRQSRRRHGAAGRRVGGRAGRRRWRRRSGVSARRGRWWCTGRASTRSARSARPG